MMNIHKLMNTATYFTLMIGSLSDLFFNLLPSVSVCFVGVTTLPIWVIFSMKTIFLPPFCRAWVTTEIIFDMFTKITNRTFKFPSTKSAILFNPISSSCTSCRTCLVTLHRTVLSIITYKAFKFIPACRAFLALFACQMFSSLSHKTKIHSIIEIDKDYFGAQEKRFRNHKAQLKLFAA